MLTIHPPIRLKSNRSLGSLHDDMNEKIRGNYDLMTNSIRKEELLHLTTSTPELYFAEGSTTNILNEVTSQTLQNFRLDVINNLINRILVSNTENFSYQDQVYISNALRKIGITDVQTFMTQVKRLQEDRRENHNLLKMYEENKNMLTSILQSQSVTNIQSETIEDNESNVEEWHLHEDIYKRLDTSNIYEQVSEYISGDYLNSQRISMQEMNISEQSMLATDLRLQEIRQEIYQKFEPMYLNHQNIYETGEAEEDVEASEEARVSSAILLNLVNQIYGIRMDRIEKNQHEWYQVAPALYNSAQNTWQRLESNQNNVTYEVNQSVTQMQEIWDGRKEEMKVLEEVTNRMNKFATEMNITNRDVTVDMQQLYRNTEILQEENEFVNLSQPYQTEAEITHLVEEKTTEVIEESEATPEQLVEQIRRINERNIENVRQVQKMQRELPKVKDVRLDKKQARQMALRALEHPEEVIREVMEREIVTPAQELINLTNEQVYEVLPETEEILRQAQAQSEARSGSVEESARVSAELAQRAADIYHNETSIIEQFNEQIIRQTPDVQMREEPFRTVSFVHKEEEHLVEEDLLDLIEQKTTQTIKRNELVTNNMVQTNRVETQVQNQVNHVTKTQVENVEELVKENVTRQLGRISDQVYGKIEKRLMTERKRRGF